MKDKSQGYKVSVKKAINEKAHTHFLIIIQLPASCALDYTIYMNRKS